MEEVKGLTEDMDPGWSWGLFELPRRDFFMFLVYNYCTSSTKFCSTFACSRITFTSLQCSLLSFVCVRVCFFNIYNVYSGSYQTIYRMQPGAGAAQALSGTCKCDADA